MEASIYNLQTEQGGNKQVTTSLTEAKVISSLSLYLTHISGIKILPYNQSENDLDMIHRDVAKHH